MQTEHYSYRVHWSLEDGEYIALCTAFPSLSYLHEKPEQALSGLVQLVGEVLADMNENAETVLIPVTENMTPI